MKIIFFFGLLFLSSSWPMTCRCLPLLSHAHMPHETQQHTHNKLEKRNKRNKKQEKEKRRERREKERKTKTTT